MQVNYALIKKTYKTLIGKSVEDIIYPPRNPCAEIPLNVFQTSYDIAKKYNKITSIQPKLPPFQKVTAPMYKVKPVVEPGDMYVSYSLVKTFIVKYYTGSIDWSRISQI